MMVAQTADCAGATGVRFLPKRSCPQLEAISGSLHGAREEDGHVNPTRRASVCVW